MRAIVSRRPAEIKPNPMKILVKESQIKPKASPEASRKPNQAGIQPKSLRRSLPAQEAEPWTRATTTLGQEDAPSQVLSYRPRPGPWEPCRAPRGGPRKSAMTPRPTESEEITQKFTA